MRIIFCFFVASSFRFSAAKILVLLKRVADSFLLFSTLCCCLDFISAISINNVARKFIPIFGDENFFRNFVEIFIDYNDNLQNLFCVWEIPVELCKHRPRRLLKCRVGTDSKTRVGLAAKRKRHSQINGGAAEKNGRGNFPPK